MKLHLYWIDSRWKAEQRTANNYNLIVDMENKTYKVFINAKQLLSILANKYFNEEPDGREGLLLFAKDYKDWLQMPCKSIVISKMRLIVQNITSSEFLQALRLSGH